MKKKSTNFDELFAYLASDAYYEDMGIPELKIHLKENEDAEDYDTCIKIKKIIKDKENLRIEVNNFWKKFFNS